MLAPLAEEIKLHRRILEGENVGHGGGVQLWSCAMDAQPWFDHGCSRLCIHTEEEVEVPTGVSWSRCSGWLSWRLGCEGNEVTLLASMAEGGLGLGVQHEARELSERGELGRGYDNEAERLWQMGVCMGVDSAMEEGGW